jgi:hypothetical protein
MGISRMCAAFNRLTTRSAIVLIYVPFFHPRNRRCFAVPQGTASPARTRHADNGRQPQERSIPQCAMGKNQLAFLFLCGLQLSWLDWRSCLSLWGSGRQLNLRYSMRPDSYSREGLYGSPAHPLSGNQGAAFGVAPLVFGLDQLPSHQRFREAKASAFTSPRSRVICGEGRVGGFLPAWLQHYQ